MLIKNVGQAQPASLFLMKQRLMAVTWHLRNPTTFAEQKDDSEGIDAKATGETDNRKGQFGTTGKKHRPSGLVRVNNGLPGQTVKGRGCNTEEGGRFGNAEAPHDDGCNPAHVWNFSFQLYPKSTAKRLTEGKLGMRTVIPLKGRMGKKTA